MTVRIRETAGTSWRDPRYPGTRHWRSTSVSYGAGWYALGWLIRYGIVWPFLLIWLWLAVECAVILVTGILALAVVAARGARLSDLTLTRLRWGLVMIDLRRQP